MSPMKPKSPCSVPGCPAFAVYRGRCAKHAAEERARYNASRRVYEQGRPSREERGYDYAYRKARAEYLAAHPTCEACGLRPAVQAHHVERISAGGERANPDNFLALCDDCHRQGHAQARRHRLA